MFNFDALAEIIAERLGSDAIAKKDIASLEPRRNHIVEKRKLDGLIFLANIALSSLWFFILTCIQLLFVLFADLIFKTEKWYYQILTYGLAGILTTIVFVGLAVLLKSVSDKRIE